MPNCRIDDISFYSEWVNKRNSMITNDVDLALSKFKELAKESNMDLTEADTRVKIIERIFKDCLGWEEDDISREPYANPGYADYLFSIDKVPRFVVEAKRESEIFTIPDSFT